MPSTAAARRTSFLPFCCNQAAVQTTTSAGNPLFQAFLHIPVQGSTCCDCIKVSRKIDIACGSGVFLEEAFDYLQTYCISWYLDNLPEHLLELGNGNYKLPLEEKKELLSCCIFGIDIDIHAVEVAKFSLLIKLIENETAPSVAESNPILPDLGKNIFYGNSLVSNQEIQGINIPTEQLVELAPFNWSELGVDDGFDAIIGNPPYVSTEGMHALLPSVEFGIYKSQYKSSYKQFDKYFIFLERAISKVKEAGYICYIIPNKFFKVGAGEKLRQLLANGKMLIRLDDFGDAQLFEDKTIYSSIVLLQKKEQETFVYSNVESANNLWTGKAVESIVLNESSLNKLPWRLTTDFDFLRILKGLDEVSVPLTDYAEIFNGIQTSAERPDPIYWFSTESIVDETEKYFEIVKDGKRYHIEKQILRPYFKPTKQKEKRLNSYSILETDKQIIFPYNGDGQLYSVEIMESRYPGTYEYLKAYYNRLVPKSISPIGTRDVPNATPETWYQYGRTQALTAFTNTPKLIVGALSKEPMYAFDNQDMLIASGGTAGYCAISKKSNSPYELEYIQAWLSSPFTEKLIDIVGSDFEGGFVARGTFVLSTLPFVELDFTKSNQKDLYDRVVAYTREIYGLNTVLMKHPSKSIENTAIRRKKERLRAHVWVGNSLCLP